MASVKGYFAIVSALVLCPCHLPILAAVLAGTAFGAAISEHFSVIFPLTAIYFVGALFLGVRWMTRSEELACTSCETPVASAEAEVARSGEGAEPALKVLEGGRPKEREPVGGATWR